MSMNFVHQLPVFIQLLLGVAILLLTPCMHRFFTELPILMDNNIKTAYPVKCMNELKILVIVAAPLNCVFKIMELRYSEKSSE